MAVPSEFSFQIPLLCLVIGADLADHLGTPSVAVLSGRFGGVSALSSVLVHR